MDMLRLLVESVDRSERLKITLHAGPVYRNPDGIAGENIRIIREIAKFSPRESFCASLNFAAVLALVPAKYNVLYAGLVSAGEEKVPVYHIGLKP
jgi:hypothetical protein